MSSQHLGNAEFERRMESIRQAQQLAEQARQQAEQVRQQQAASQGGTQ